MREADNMGHITREHAYELLKLQRYLPMKKYYKETIVIIKRWSNESRR